MNIVQLQYKLRDLPESAVRAAANGRFPEIPEMLATMELNRRARLEKTAAQPPTKSIKEQLEEKLTTPTQEQMGLPGVLQQAQQAVGQPQQDQVQQPGQPQQQAQQMAQQPAQQMRMGGVAGLPSGMFKQFYGGGIVAFAEGDLVENESAAETARLKRAEAMAVAQELQAARTGSAPVELPPEVVRANNIIRSAPYADEAARAFRDIASGSEITTPEQEMDRRKALQEKYGIRAPGEDELARIAASEKAYERDRQERAQYQAMKTLAESARPNIYGRYMPGTAAGATSAFGLANLEADRTYRDLNEKAKVAAKESQRAFELGNLNDAIALANKSKEFDRESRKIAASGFGQMASSATTAQSQQLSTQENARYHDMWENMENKKLKADIARTAASLQINAPELLKVVEGIKKSMPQLASKMTDGQLLDYAAGKIAESRGAEDRSESAYNQALRARDEKISAAIQTKPTVMNARSKLDKAMKSGSQVDIDQAERDLLQAVARERRIIEAGMTPLIKPSRPGEGIASPAAPANPNAGQPTIKYDIKGNRVVTPSPIPQ